MVANPGDAFQLLEVVAVHHGDLVDDEVLCPLPLHAHSLPLRQLYALGRTTTFYTFVIFFPFSHSSISANLFQVSRALLLRSFCLHTYYIY